MASTKAFTGQVTVLTLLALALGHELGTLSDAVYQETIAELDIIPEKMQRVLKQNDKIKKTLPDSSLTPTIFCIWAEA